PRAFTMWLAGGGIKPGITLGQTDELGYHVVEDAVHIHDLQATVLRALGVDHQRLTYRTQGRDFRLTDVGRRAVGKLLLWGAAMGNDNAAGGLTRGELFRVFMKAGLAFGGSLGMVAALEEELVHRRRLVGREDFLATYALGRVVPCGTNTALAVAFGHRFG